MPGAGERKEALLLSYIHLRETKLRPLSYVYCPPDKCGETAVCTVLPTSLPPQRLLPLSVFVERVFVDSDESDADWGLQGAHF